MPRRARQQQETRFGGTERRAVIAARHDPAAAGDDDQRPCARGDFCASENTVTRWADGQREVTPDTSYRAFCDADRAAIRDALAAFPGKWDQLAAELGEHGSDRQHQRGKLPSAPMEYRGDVDALMRLLTDILLSWHARIAEIPGAGVEPFPPMDARARFRGGGNVLYWAAHDLAPRVDALIGLGPRLMLRTISPARWRDLLAVDPAAVAMLPGAHREATLESGEVIVSARLDGTRAGLEILSLEYRCRAVLGETDPKAESLDGVRCYKCQQPNTLVRADPPEKPGDPEYYSRCRRGSCGHQMTEAEYRRQVARLFAAQGGRIITPVLEADGIPA